MVNHIDIHTLTLEELSGVVSLYPWYAAARVELTRRMSKLGMLSEGQLAQTAMYIASRRIAAEIGETAQSEDCSDKDAAAVVGRYIGTDAPKRKQVYVVGGDYFSQEQYNQAQQGDDGIYAQFVNSKKSSLPPLPPMSEYGDFCTETLAQIYLEQDYWQEAVEIYSKLSLRYPEKSIYFASLIEEINKKNQ